MSDEKNRERLQFLALPGTFTHSRDEDAFRSDCPLGKKIRFMANGRQYFASGENLIEAVDNAIAMKKSIR